MASTRQRSRKETSPRHPNPAGLTRVRLTGHLGKKYGREFYVDVNSPAGAVRMLEANFPGFVNDVRPYRFIVRIGTRAVTEGQLCWNCRRASEITIAPVATGSGNSKGVGQVIAGVALIAAAFVIGFASEGALTPLAFQVGALGGSLLLTGTISPQHSFHFHCHV